MSIWYYIAIGLAGAFFLGGIVLVAFIFIGGKNHKKNVEATEAKALPKNVDLKKNKKEADEKDKPEEKAHLKESLFDGEYFVPKNGESPAKVDALTPDEVRSRETSGRPRAKVKKNTDNNITPVSSPVTQPQQPETKTENELPASLPKTSLPIATKKAPLPILKKAETRTVVEEKPVEKSEPVKPERRQRKSVTPEPVEPSPFATEDKGAFWN